MHIVTPTQSSLRGYDCYRYTVTGPLTPDPPYLVRQTNVVTTAKYIDLGPMVFDMVISDRHPISQNFSYLTMHHGTATCYIPVTDDAGFFYFY